MLSDTLSALKRQIETDTAQKLAEQRARFDAQLAQAVSSVKDESHEFSRQYCQPLVDELSNRLGAEAALSAERAAATAKFIADTAESLEVDSRKRMADLNSRLVDLSVEVAPMHSRLQILESSVERLDSALPEVRRMIEDVGQESQRSCENTKTFVVESLRRVDEVDAKMSGRCDELKAFLEARCQIGDMALEQIKEATRRASRLEACLHARLEEFCCRTSERIDGVQREAAAASECRTRQGISEFEQTTEVRQAARFRSAEQRLTATESECHGVVMEAAMEANRNSQEVLRRSLMEASSVANLESTIHRGLESSSAELVDLRDRVNAESDRLSERVCSVEAAALAAAAESRKQLAGEVDRKFARMLTALRKENTRTKEATGQNESAWAAAQNCKLESCEAACRRDVEELSAHCERAAAKAVGDAVAIEALRKEARPGSSSQTSLQSCADGVAEVLAGLRCEVAESRSMMHKESERLRKELLEETGRAAVASATAQGNTLERLSAAEAALDRQRWKLDWLDRELRREPREQSREAVGTGAEAARMFAVARDTSCQPPAT